MAQVTGRPASDPYVRRLALASWRNYGRYAADFMSFPHLDVNLLEENLRDLSEGGNGWLKQLESALQAGQGAIVATAHFGNWAMAGALHYDHLPLFPVAESLNDERLNLLMQ